MRHSLSRVPWLAILPPNAQARLEQQLVPRTFCDEEVLFHQADAGTELYLIEEGAVRICRETMHGREVTLAIRWSGEFVGDMAILDGEPRSASAIAHGGTCRCLVLSGQTVREALLASPESGLILLGFLSRRLRESSDRLEELAVRPVRQRLASALAGIARREGMEQEGLIYLPRWVGIGSLIGLLGTVRESVSRATRDLTVEGLIEKRGRQFCVRDLEGLARVALE